jgi:surface antigen
LTTLFELLNTVMPYHSSIRSTARSTARNTARSFFRAALGTLLFAGAPLPAWPADAAWLRNTPLGQLDQRDIEALDSTVRVVLNTRSDGETSRWTNRGSGNPVEISATLTPEGTSLKHGRTCRFVAVTMHAKGKTVKLRPQYCQPGDGSWERQKSN